MLIHYIVTSLERGGAEFSIPSVVNVFRSLGHDVHVYACEPRDRVAESRLVHANIPYTVMFHKSASKFGSIYRYATVVKRSRPDIIWASLSHATIVAQIVGWAYGVPVISWKHSADAKRYIRWSQCLSKLWIADSIDVAWYLEKCMGVDPGRIATWPLFNPNLAKEPIKRWDGRGLLRIGSLGRLHPQKNYDALIRSIAQLRKSDPVSFSRIEVSIAGDGPLRNELQSLILSLGLQEKVYLLGWVEDVQSYLGEINLYIQPSAYEGMCIAAHEAMAAGLAVVATPAGEMRNSVQTGITGILIEGDIIGGIVAAVRHFTKNPDDLAKYGEAAKEYVRSAMGEESFIKAGKMAFARAASFVV